jgi:acetyltransferase-like isoleucine patch superfamily enzyme
MTLGTILRRFFIFGPLVSLIAYVKYRALISPKAEVELSHGLRIGAQTRISSFTKLKSADGPLTIGRNVDIASHCFIASAPGGIEVGDDSMIGPGSAIVATNFHYGDISRPIRLQGKESKGIRIGSNVWLGAGVMVIDGATIGDGVIVTPNSVVSGRVPDNVIIQGNPARVIFKRR